MRKRVLDRRERGSDPPPRIAKKEMSAGAPVAFDIIFAKGVEDQLKGLTARDRRAGLDGIEEQLIHQPTLETRIRKRMRPNPLANWELRLGNLRVYYRVPAEVANLVEVAAIGVKEGNEVWIGGEKVDL